MIFRAWYPWTWHLGILNTWSWRNLRVSMYMKVSLTFSCPFPLQQVIKGRIFWPLKQLLRLHVRCAFPIPKGIEHSHLWRHKVTEKTLNKQVLLSSFPWFIIRSQCICPTIFLHYCLQSIKPTVSAKVPMILCILPSWRLA
jgi:hypothetical protein